MDETTNWIDITIKADPQLLEELSASFFEIGCQGIHENDDSFTLYFAEAAWDDDLKMAVKQILEKKKINETDIGFHVLKDENWNEQWKEHFKTFRVGNNLIVKPDWENYTAKAREKVITISPKMAFGTGHHATTQLILKELEGIIKPAVTVLDAGTGSAILAIAAARLGASKITAFDVDSVAIENAQENTNLNGVSDRIDLKCCKLQEIERADYDCIIANINRNVLLELAGSFKDYAHVGTLLLLSGLLVTDRDVVADAYAQGGWKLKKKTRQDEWMCLTFKIV